MPTALIFTRRPYRQDRCTCTRVYCPVDPRDHDTTCIGRHPAGWRARMPAFLLPEVDAILAGEPRSAAPIVRALALEYAVVARYGLTLAHDTHPDLLTPTTQEDTGA